MTAEARLFLGFPPPLLGLRPLRLPVIWDDGDLLALDKPPGLLVTADKMHPRLPVLTEAIRHEAARGKPECVRAGIGPEGLLAIFAFDPEITGPALFARTAAAAEHWRNAYGSSLLCLHFHLLTERAPDRPEVHCELPIARHATQPRMLVSHTTGKQAATTFTRIERIGAHQLWEARTNYLRPHQVRLHARECGFEIPGEYLYGRTPPLLLSRIKRGYRPSRTREEQPLHTEPLLHLARIALPDGRVIDAAPPRTFTAVLNQLRRAGGRQ